MPRVANCETVKTVTVSLGGVTTPLGPSDELPIWSVTAPGGAPLGGPIRGQVHPSVTAGTAYTGFSGSREESERIYKVNPNGVENPAFYDSEPARTFKTLPPMGGSTLKKHFHQYNTASFGGGGTRGVGVRAPEKKSWLRWWKLRFRNSHVTSEKGGGSAPCCSCCCCGGAAAPRVRRRCSLAAIIGIVLLLVFLVATTAVVLYLTIGGGLQAFSSDYSEDGFWAVEGVFQITNRDFQSSMSDSSTSAFRLLASEIIKSLDELFFQSVLVKQYNGSDVMSFSQTSVMVVVRIFLNEPMVGAAAEVGMAFEKAVEQGHGILPAGNLHVNIRNLKFRNLRDVYPPPKSAWQMTNLDAAWSQWSDWTTCKLVGCNPSDTQRRFRDCRLERGYGEALSNVQPCMEQGGAKQEIRGCPCGHPSTTQATTETRPLLPSSTPFPYLGLTSKLTTALAQKETNPASATTTAPITTQSSPVKSSFLTQVTTTHGTTEIVTVPGSVGVHPCESCVPGEICFLASDSNKPSCVKPLGTGDPRGCGGHCTGENHVCRKLDSRVVKCVDASDCVPGEWRCGNGLCIPEARRCDGHFNCFDSTDERNCDCKSDEFHCGNRTSCLPIAMKCNGHVDCWDGNDEVNCTRLCPADQYTCSNGQCIKRDYFCDRHRDCLDGSDEPSGCESPCTGSGTFLCDNGRCIAKELTCNKLNDCGDRSDERLCWSTTQATPRSTSPRAIFTTTVVQRPSSRNKPALTTTSTTTPLPDTWLPVWKET